MNGGFETGIQFWRGDGKIVTLQDGNKVCQVEASKQRVRMVSQEFQMPQRQVEILFRARSINYKGPGLRISMHVQGGGSLLWDRPFAEDGEWKDYKLSYTRDGANERRQLVIGAHTGSGLIQIDNVEVREPTTVVTENIPAKPLPSPVRPPSAGPPPAPAAPLQITPQPAAGAPFTSLGQVVDSAPQPLLRKLKESPTNPETVAALNEYFTKNVLGRHASIKGSVKATQEIIGQSNKFRVNYLERCVGPNAADIQRCWFWAYFDQDAPTTYLSLHEGSEVTVSGNIDHCEAKIPPGGDFVRLNVNLTNSKIEPH
jgi:hypothetical protein